VNEKKEERDEGGHYWTYSSGEPEKKVFTRHIR